MQCGSLDSKKPITTEKISKFSHELTLVGLYHKMVTQENVFRPQEPITWSLHLPYR